MEEIENKYDFNNYKKEIFDFNRSNVSYKERVGEPDELSSVIGLISVGFQRLEDVLSAFIIELLEIEIPKGKIIVAELSFTNKVNMFSSLFHLLKNKRNLNHGEFDKDEYFKELRKSILRCQDFRNQVIHSSFIQNFKTDFKINKHKMSAKSKKGLTEINSEIDIPFLFDIYDYMISISMEIEQFFIDFNPKRKIGDDMYKSTELSDIFKYRI
jgi:hypothetical protein